MTKRLGCIYVGGKGRRLGGRDKALIELGGRPLWQYAARRLEPHVEEVVVTAPTPPSWCKGSNAPRFLEDGADTDQAIGPAGGLLGALREGARLYGEGAQVMTAPVDAPFFTDQLCLLLINEMKKGVDVVMPSHGGFLQPAFAIWSVYCVPMIEEAVGEGEYSLKKIAYRMDVSEVVHSADADFFNINRPEDLARAEVLAQTSLT